MTEEMQESFQEMFNKANADPEVPKIYANGFSCSLGTGDVVLLLKRAEESVGMVNMSYTIAKTLVIKLNGLIKYLEDKSERTIMTSDDVTKFLADGRNSDEAGK